jgi:ankyrin repeat protein
MKTEAIAAAAQAGDLEFVRLLLAYGADPKGVGRNGSTAVLMSAALPAVPEILETILAGHPDVNARDEKGHTAL